MRRRPFFIVNPTAGGGRPRRLLPMIADYARRRGSSAEVVSTERPGHASELGRRAADAGFGPNVGVGGDGTLHAIANGLLASSPSAPVAVIPCGAGNDFAALP